MVRPILLTVCLLIASPAWAQDAAGRASGRVSGPDEQPLAGASVRVWPQGEEATARPPVTTDEEGRWSVSGLDPGRWEIAVTADGHFPASGWFQVPVAGPAAVVEVSLRSLAERTPSFAENRSTVLRWIEKGNVLLTQGEPAAARAEYEKALPVLPRAERPEVLQAIARTHFMENELDWAIERLQEALGIAPDNAELEQLFRALLDRAGRAGEVESLLAAAAAVTPEEPPSAAAPADQRRPELSPPVEAVAGRTGRFRTIFDQRSPLSDVAVYRERFALPEEQLREVDPAGGVYEIADESFELFVPESYDSERPHGLLVWVSPSPYGGFRNPEFERVLAEYNLIWIGAHQSGNSRWGWYRIGLALDAVHNARRLYAIDERRIYVAGYSGGGRISSQASMLYSEIFTGGLFLYGCDYFEPLPVPDRPGASWPARFPAPSKAVVQGLMSDSRFVLLTGDADFNRAQTRQIHKRMEARGFENLTYLQIPDADHYFGLPAEWLEKALAALDAPL